jgi:GNAT superfamily N-acetyltransferase
MSDRIIKTAELSDMDRIVDLLVLAFDSDPVERWLYPDPHAYLVNFPIFLRALIAKSFECHQVYYLDNFAGAVLWLPPDVYMDEEPIIAALDRTVDIRKHADTLAVNDLMTKYHPKEPHWYLAIIGVDPAHQGKGVGTLLLEYTLDVCDREQKLAYLESTNPKNISLYERHGFECIGTIRSGEVPPMIPMIRSPQ